MEAEVTSKASAGLASGARRLAHRSGHRAGLGTRGEGALELQVPKVREGNYIPWNDAVLD